MKMKTKMIDSYERLPLGAYLDIMALVRDESMDEADRQVAIVSLLSGVPEADLLRMPIADFRALSVQARFLEEQIPERKLPPTRTMRLGDLTVTVTTKVTRITTAQYIDFQTFIGDPSRLAELLSCFLIPFGCEYGEGYDPAEVHEAIRTHMMVTDAQALAAFFFSRLQRLTGSILIYSAMTARRIREREKRMKAKEECRKAWETFRSAGDGWRTLTRWLVPPASRGLRYGA